MIELKPLDWLENFAWWGMRYCIGRQSYASGTWADILDVLEKNREEFISDKKVFDRLKYFAADIRAEISTIVGFIDGILVQQSHNSQIVEDAYSLLVRHLSNPKCNAVFNSYDFEINCRTCQVYLTRPRNMPRSENSFSMGFPRSDFHGWIKLANSIDKRKLVTLEDGNGNEEKVLCSEMPVNCEGKVEMVYSPIKYLSANRWYDNSYVVKVEDGSEV